MTKRKQPARPIWIVAAALAWLLPGAGHVYLGRWKRGIILFLAIAATFWTGVAVGGVMTVDSRYDRWWFYAQSLTGVHGLVGWCRQHRQYEALDRDPRVQQETSTSNDRSDRRQMRSDQLLQAEGKSLAYPAENIARAYTGVAGLLNLLCIFDALMLAMIGTRGEGRPAEKTPEPTGGTA